MRWQVVHRSFDRIERVHERIVQSVDGKRSEKFVDAEADADLLMSNAIIAGEIKYS